MLLPMVTKRLSQLSSGLDFGSGLCFCGLGTRPHSCGLGAEINTTTSLFDLQGAFMLMCCQEGLLDFENEKYVVFYLHRAQLLFDFCCFGLSVHRGQTLAA